jgi:hypothetical protein
VGKLKRLGIAKPLEAVRWSLKASLRDLSGVYQENLKTVALYISYG